MFFNPSELNIATEALKAYDANHTQKTETATAQDPLTSLLNSIKTQTPATVAVQNDEPPSLPNLYLGSIVYYSPGNWSIWINGKKLVNRYNNANHEFHVTRIARSQVEMVWKPVSLGDMPLLIKERMAAKEAIDRHITVDLQKGTITLQLKPNQTFLPKSLAIREGLVKSVPVAPAPSVVNSTNPSGIPPAAGTATNR